MHGLVNRSIQNFVADTCGAAVWAQIAQAADLPPEGFEPMLTYDDMVTDQLLNVAAEALGKPEATLLEDLGTYLVSHDTNRRVRRLLRFSGETFADFLHSLDDLPSRTKLAMPDLELPELELREEQTGNFRLFVCSMQRGWGYVMLGLLRAMADDYGALALLEMAPGPSSIAVVEIGLLDSAFAEGRSFSLAEQDWGLPADAEADVPSDASKHAGGTGTNG
ncbi:MAG: heme NO-binding domain-containing protein [Pseudomonadota bacterium]